MKVKITIAISLITLIISVIFALKMSMNNHKEKSYPCEVLDKMVNQKQSYSDFLLIIKVEGEVKSLSVGAATYSQTRVGEIVNFNISDQDLDKPSHSDWWIPLTVISFIVFAFSMLYYLENH